MIRTISCIALLTITGCAATTTYPEQPEVYSIARYIPEPQCRALPSYDVDGWRYVWYCVAGNGQRLVSVTIWAIAKDMRQILDRYVWPSLGPDDATCDVGIYGVPPETELEICLSGDLP